MPVSKSVVALVPLMGFLPRLAKNGTVSCNSLAATPGFTLVPAELVRMPSL